MCRRVFMLQCLKRSDDKKTVWWGPNNSGYTSDIFKSGQYSAKDLENCAGDRGDWIAHPLWIRCRSRIEGRWECDE